jgi:hypothetical protein
MKKLQIPVTDELMNAAKLYAFQNGTTLKDVVTAALAQYITSNTSTTSITTTTTISGSTSSIPNITTQSEHVNKLVLPSEETHFILRKTAKTRTETQNRMAQLGPYQWVVMEGNKSHYDKDNNIIPIRFTAPDGEVCEPDADELKELEEAFGKPVHIEK